MTKSFHAEYIGKKHHRMDIIDSTNNYAQKLIANNSPTEGTVISAAFQTSGKGQYGRNWQGMAGQNIYMSIILKPDFINVNQQFLLNKAISLGIAHALQSLIDHKVSIKWPNDVYINHCKVGGILIQNSVLGTTIMHSIVGIGINVNQTAFDNIPNPTSLSLASNQIFDLDDVKNVVFNYLEYWYEEIRSANYTRIDQTYNKMLYGKGLDALFLKNKQYLKGSIVGVDDAGRILLDHNNFTSAYHHHEVSMVIQNS